MLYRPSYTARPSIASLSDSSLCLSSILPLMFLHIPTRDLSSSYRNRVSCLQATHQCRQRHGLSDP